MDALTWADLGTLAGVAGATALLTQIIKYFIKGVDPKWFALAVAVVATFGSQLISGRHGPGDFALSAFNAVLAAGLAIGGYEGAIKAVQHAFKLSE